MYFSRSNNDKSIDDEGEKTLNENPGVSSANCKQPVLEGRLHFAMFETSKMNDCLEFIDSKKLHLGGMYLAVCLLFLDGVF